MNDTQEYIAKVQQIEELERLVDKWGLSFLLSTLEQVCYEKADHITMNWQDPNLAKSWETVGKKLGKLEDSLPEHLQ
jgi:predicted metalloenzyme YecM